MENQSIAVITVPLSEWHDALALLKDTSEKVAALVTPELNELLTPNEVCKMLKIGRTTFERMKNKGEISIIKPEGQKKVWVKRSEIEKMLTGYS